MSWFEHGAVRVYYEESGAGETVLLLPGWSVSIDELGPLREALAATYRVIAADLPGSGKSTPQPRTYTPSYLEDDARTFLAMLDELSAVPTHVVGFSDGGECALLMAELRPQAIRSVAAWGAAGSLGDNAAMAGAMASMVDDPIPPMRGFAEYLKATYGEANARVMTQSLASALLEIIAAGGDISRARAASIECPVLLVTGADDFLATPALVSDMANAIPRSELLVVKGAGHSVLDDQPALLTAAITDFLAKA